MWGILRRGTALVAMVAAGHAAAPRASTDEPRAAESAATPDPDKPEAPPPPQLTERVVVSASATGEALLDAPAAVDVLDGQTLEQRPADTVVDQLRRVPGINVVQFSARDTNISSRSATGGINTSTLVLSDGRSLYQDFLGFVMWEFAPTDMALVDRVEVVRGPASSIWGANAVGGVVHLLTKSPRDTLGGAARLSLGSYDSRRIDAHHSFLAGPWALRVSGSFFESEPFDRPQTIRSFLGGTTDADLGLIDEGYRDSGTRQPRLDLRADWTDGTSNWMLNGGSGRTRGWIATGIGPFDIDPSTSMSYVQGRYRRGPWEAQVYSNLFDGNGLNLISALPFGFTSTLTHASFRGHGVIAQRAALGWGVELERST